MEQLDKKMISLQIKIFSRWVSAVLRKRGIIVKDITTQLSTGVNLIMLADELIANGKQTKFTRNPTKTFQKIQNCELAFEAFKKDGVNIVNIVPKDITDGNVKRILSLIWKLIKKYKIEKFSGAPSPSEKPSRVIIQSIFRWFIRQITLEDRNLNITKPYCFTFAALISRFRSDLLDYKKEIRENVSKEEIAQKVINVLKELEIPALLDWEDLLFELDKRSLLTQIAYIKNAFEPDVYIESDPNSIDNLLEECESEELMDNDRRLDIDIDEDSQSLPNEVETFEEPQSKLPFMLLMTIRDPNGNHTEMAMTVVKGSHFLNSAGLKIDLAPPDSEDKAQLFTFGEGEWITVVDSVLQKGMVWDVANRDDLNPPEGTPFYMFMFHGRHNQRFTYKNGRIIAKQNGQVVTYVGGEYPMVMRKDNSSLLQTFRLKYV